MSTEVLDRLEAAVAELQAVELAAMPPAEQLRFVRRLEVLGRRVDAGTDRATALLDATAAFSLDGHRNVRSAVTHLGRLSGAEGWGGCRPSGPSVSCRWWLLRTTPAGRPPRTCGRSPGS